MKKTEFAPQDYYAHVPTMWRKVGDTVLVATTGLEGMIIGLPIEENTKLWLNFAVGIVGLTVKVLTNCFKYAYTESDSGQIGEGDTPDRGYS